MTDPVGTVTTREYGTSEIVGFDGPRRVEIYRPFVVSPREPWNREITERPFCLNHQDASPVASAYAAQLGKIGAHIRPYDERCSHCYFGHLHTVALHDARIGT